MTLLNSFRWVESRRAVTPQNIDLVVSDIIAKGENLRLDAPAILSS